MMNKKTYETPDISIVSFEMNKMVMDTDYSGDKGDGDIWGKGPSTPDVDVLPGVDDIF